MANLNNFPPTPSETYSDDDQDIYKSPADNYSTSVLASDEASNDANDQYKYSTENLDGTNLRFFHLKFFIKKCIT